jgi:hypothetical protein
MRAVRSTNTIARSRPQQTILQAHLGIDDHRSSSSHESEGVVGGGCCCGLAARWIRAPGEGKSDTPVQGLSGYHVTHLTVPSGSERV